MRAIPGWVLHVRYTRIVSVWYMHVYMSNTGFQARSDLAAFSFPPSVCLSDALVDSIFTPGRWNTGPRVG